MEQIKLLLNACELMAFLTGVWCFRKTSHPYLKYFTYLLGFIFLVEITGKCLHYADLPDLNQNMYKYFAIPIQFIFYFIFYAKQNEHQKQRITIYSFVIIYFILLVIEFFIKEKISTFSFSYMTGVILLLFTVFNYLFNYIHSEDFIRFASNPLFYISLGLLVFYIGSFPFNGLKSFLWLNYKSIGLGYWYVMMSLNCIMYCMFTYSFLCSKQKFI